MEVSVNINGGNIWKDHIKKIADQKFDAKVGIFNSTYSGEFGTDTQQSVAQVAYWNEYGTDTIPARAPFRTASKLKATSWSQLLARQLQGHPLGVEAALWNVGDKIAKDIQQLLLHNLLSPPLKKETIIHKRKEGFLSPEIALIRTRTLVKTIISKIEKRYL